MALMEGSLVARKEEGLPSMVVATRAIVYLVSIFTLIVCSTRVSIREALSKNRHLTQNQLYLRKYVIRSFGLDDYMVVVALVSLLIPSQRF